MPDERVKRRRRGRYGFLPPLLITAALLISLVLTGGLFFKIKEIRVEGAYAVNPAEVAALSGYSQGDNMFLINKAAAARAITVRLPYVRSVRIRRDWPGSVVIIITEAAPAAMAEYRGAYWLFDAQGRILETESLLVRPKMPLVKGFSLLDPMIGTKVFPDYSDTEKLEPLLMLLRALQAEDMWQDTGEIDMSLLSNLRFTYAGIYRVELGPPEELNKKLKKMISALEREEISGKGAGTFYLADAADDRPVRFMPDNN
jgi:cell division septal protein FtsQ